MRPGNRRWAVGLLGLRRCGLQICIPVGWFWGETLLLSPKGGLRVLLAFLVLQTKAGWVRCGHYFRQRGVAQEIPPMFFPQPVSRQSPCPRDDAGG